MAEAMAEVIIGAIFGFVVGVIASVTWVTGNEDGRYHQATQALAQCEAELPRNQKCIITAEVEKNE